MLSKPTARPFQFCRLAPEWVPASSAQWFPAKAVWKCSGIYTSKASAPTIIITETSVAVRMKNVLKHLDFSSPTRFQRFEISARPKPSIKSAVTARWSCYFPRIFLRLSAKAPTVSFLSAWVGTYILPPASWVLSPCTYLSMRVIACLPNSYGCWTTVP
jgi:hypothetical protein